ncbi:MAG: adenylate/guanylate cyclase domain-containing protein [Rhodospirillales bacterium]|nr:adenylate/guanylate cyclase domain-containing protein [Rhodospirillales bacterium]
MSEADASYEVCVQVGSRWEIHARYPVEGANAAIEEAKQLEQTSKGAVKVVREVYDNESGLYKQVVVYKSAHAAGRQDSSASRALDFRSQSGRSDAYNPFDDIEDDYDDSIYAFDDDDDDDEDDLYTGAESRRRRAFRKGRKAPKDVTPAKLLLRIAIVIMVGLTIAAVVTGFLPVFAPNLAARDIILFSGARTNTLFVVFVGTFLFSFATLAMLFLTGLRIVMPPRRRRVVAAAATQQRARPARRRLSRPPEPILKPFDEPEPSPPAPETEGASASPDPETEEENILDGPTEEASEQQAPLSATGEQHRQTMQAFLGGAVQDVQAAGQIDAFSRFGINLFLAGTVDSLTTTQGLEANDAHVILSQAVQALGTPKDMAQKFADNSASYLMQPRYIEMYEMGRSAMMTFLEGDAEGSRKLAPALEAWRNPTKTEEKTGPLAVLFTDIVGSTNMTVTIGDEAAQYVVRTHNRIVRSALTNFKGREIKHTGDGIMASFSTVSNSVEAAIEMQRRVAANNAAEGDIPLHLCIGINAGEPVVEDDDLFGVTVQLSARLCAAAESDEIIVSEVVRGLCTGKPISFESRGTRDMKGFKEPVPIYEVIWKEG